VGDFACFPFPEQVVCAVPQDIDFNGLVLRVNEPIFADASLSVVFKFFFASVALLRK
jgi:hypothetical protein